MTLGHSFLSIESAAMTKKATPAHQPLPVRYHTMKATTAAGMRIRIRRMRKMMISPIIINAISPSISPVGNGRLDAISSALVLFHVIKIIIVKANCNSQHSVRRVVDNEE
jgi:hypothetical protein